jgi:gliding motility-associated-like protein
VANWQSLIWTPLPDPNCPQCLLQTWAPANTATYRVEVVDTFGCRAEAQIEISVAKLKEIYVPNVFSPDEDGVEDLFVIHAGKSVALLLEMSVYNRWGNLVYHWDEPVEPDFWPGWDGRIDGKTGQSAVYVYVLRAQRLDGREITQTGDVTLIYP